MEKGKWTHVALVMDSKGAALYKNGAQVSYGARKFKSVDNGKPLLIGAMGNLPSGQFYFNGLIDEVVIYNEALSAEAVKSLAAWEFDPAAWQTGQASITLTSPVGGENWSIDSPHWITWQSNRISNKSPVKIEFTTDNGTTWQSIDSAAANTDKFLWHVPKTLATTCRVRISRGTVTEQNVSPFSIIPSQKVRDYEWIKMTISAPFAPRDGSGRWCSMGECG